VTTKSEQIAALLLRPEGTTYCEVMAVTGWAAVSLPWHARNNGLKLRIEKINGHPQRYFAERRKIEVRKIVKRWQPPAPPQQQQSALAAFCAANNFIISHERKGRVLRCQHCYFGFRIFQNDDSVNPYLSKHIKQHAEIHRRHEAKKELHE
jgi:hypothetical protein